MVHLSDDQWRFVRRVSSAFALIVPIAVVWVPMTYVTIHEGWNFDSMFFGVGIQNSIVVGLPFALLPRFLRKLAIRPQMEVRVRARVIGAAILLTVLAVATFAWPIYRESAGWPQVLYLVLFYPFIRLGFRVGACFSNLLRA